MSRIYLVKNKQTDAELLVDSNTPSAAVRFAANDIFSAEVANQSDLVRLVTKGVQVQKALTDNEPESEPEQPQAKPEGKKKEKAWA